MVKLVHCLTANATCPGTVPCTTCDLKAGLRKAGLRTDEGKDGALVHKVDGTLAQREARLRVGGGRRAAYRQLSTFAHAACDSNGSPILCLQLPSLRAPASRHPASKHQPTCPPGTCGRWARPSP